MTEPRLSYEGFIVGCRRLRGVIIKYGSNTKYRAWYSLL